MVALMFAMMSPADQMGDGASNRRCPGAVNRQSGPCSRRGRTALILDGQMLPA